MLQTNQKPTNLPEEHMSKAEENTELSRCGSPTDNLKRTNSLTALSEITCRNWGASLEHCDIWD